MSFLDDVKQRSGGAPTGGTKAPASGGSFLDAVKSRAKKPTPAAAPAKPAAPDKGVFGNIVDTVEHWFTGPTSTSTPPAKLTETKDHGAQSMTFEVGKGLTPEQNNKAQAVIFAGGGQKAVDQYRKLQSQGKAVSDENQAKVTEKAGGEVPLAQPITIKVPFVDAGITTAAGPVEQATKNLVELPERVVSSLVEAGQTLLAGQYTPKDDSKSVYNVDTYLQTRDKFKQGLLDNGMDATQAEWVSGVFAGSSAILDIATLGQGLETGAKLLASQSEIDPTALKSAKQLLGDPSNTQEAEASYRRLQQVAHPDKGGSTELSAQLNNAIRIVRAADKEGLLGAAARAAKSATADLLGGTGAEATKPLVSGLLEEKAGSTPPVAPKAEPSPLSGAPATKPTSVQLNSEIVPGASKFAEKDIVPKIDKIKNAITETKDALSPQFASPSATKAADAVRKAKAIVKNLTDIDFATNKNLYDYFEKQGPETNIGSISTYEKTGQFPAGTPDGYSEFFKTSMDASHKALQAAYGKDSVGYVENYVRRAFKFGTPEAETAGTSYLENQVRSLSATKSVTQSRVLDMPLDEALADMKARGIDVQLRSTNPEELRQWTVANARQASVYKDAWSYLKDNGLIKFVRGGGKNPDGLVALNDRVASIFFPSDKGLVRAGQYFADPNVARVLNNTISSGLENSSLYQVARSINNGVNQFQLGLSGFHMLGTAVNASISDFGLGMKALLRGEVGTAATKVAGSIVPFKSFTSDLYKGAKLFNDLKANNPDAFKFLEEKLNPAGGRLRMETKYRNDAYKNMIAAFKEGNFPGAVLRFPLAVVEKFSNPLMEYAIPRVKVGAFMDLANDVEGRLPPDATPEQKQRAYAQAWDSIDNRFGQLVYDNLFWNKTMQDLSQVSFRSVGWNLGTIRELGGGVTDIGTKTLKGQGVSDRTMYALGLPVYIGIMGAIYQYLHTGQGPQSITDYYYPLNGLTDANGNPDRVSLPSYMKDVIAYSQSPIQTLTHKTSPLVQMITELATNRDYFNDMIRNPDDPASVQLTQLANHFLTETAPFSVQNLFNIKKEGGSAEQQAESFLGINKAPRSTVKSADQTAIEAEFQKERGLRGPQTPEQKDVATLKTKAREELKQGITTSLDELIKQGIVKPGKSLRDFLKNANLSSTSRLYKALTKVGKTKLLKQGIKPPPKK